MTICIVPQCPLDGLVDASVVLPDGDTVTGLACFPHAYPVEEPEPDRWPAGSSSTVAPAPAVELLPAAVVDDRAFHVDVTAGLAAMLLEHAAMAIGDDDTSADDAMVSLAGNTAFTNDVAAGILVALTWIAAAGGVTADMLLEGAQVYEQMADTEEDAPADGDDDDAVLVGDLADDDDTDEDTDTDAVPFSIDPDTIAAALDVADQDPDDDSSSGNTNITEMPDNGSSERETNDGQADN